MRLLWFCLLCTSALLVEGQELDCTEPCSCCKLNGSSVCAFHPAIGANFCFDGCVDTIYGHKCKDRCSGNCLKCEQEHGTPCYACKNTYFNTSTHCSQKCSNGCNDSLCDDDGTCLNGCKKGFMGHTCETPCYVNCIACEQITGVCKECINNSMYGTYCNNTCIANCIYNECNKDTGVCIHGFTECTENGNQQKDRVSVGLTIGATFIGFVAGIIVCLIGLCILKRLFVKNENEMVAPGLFPTRNITEGVTNAAVQEQTAYELFETSTSQRDRNARIHEQF